MPTWSMPRWGADVMWRLFFPFPPVVFAPQISITIKTPWSGDVSQVIPVENGNGDEVNIEAEPDASPSTE